MTFTGLRSDIRYEPYLFVFSCMDAEWSQRRTQCDRAPYRAVAERFREICTSYAEKVERNFRALRVASAAPDESLDNALFNPVFYFPWGHADVLSFVLVDDFDPLHHVTADLNTPVEELALGFCPSLSSLQANSSDGMFCSLHELIERKRRFPDGHPEPFEHAFQRALPLLVYTRWKFDGMATAGFALLFQAALFVAIRLRVEQVIAALTEEWKSGGSVRQLVERETDLRSFKCSLVDLQGAEELGTLMMCRNYTVAMTVVAALRNLTYADLFDAGSAGRRLQVAMSGSDVHRRLLILGCGAALNGRVWTDRIRANHVFRWTNTTLAVAPSVFYPSDSSHGTENCGGFVAGLCEYEIAPGHHGTFLGRVTRAVVPREGRPDFSGCKYELFQVGRRDWICPVTDSHDGDSLPLFELRDIVALVTSNLKKFGRASAADPGRHVVDSATTLCVPVAVLSEKHERLNPLSNVSEDHTAPLSAALSKIQGRLCFPEELPKTEQNSIGTRPGRLSVRRVADVPRALGIPVPLRRTVHCLYQNFAILLADYFTFDVVIDLYDAFATLHSALTDELPIQRAEELRHLGQAWPPPLDEGRVGRIAQFVDGLQNALAHRLAKSYAAPSERELAVDMRGGLNQLLFAADTPLKCGLGLLRKYALPSGERTNRSKVGGLTRVSYQPGTRVSALDLGIEDKALLCLVEADVPHILHVASFADYVHEAAHLILTAIVRRRPKTDPLRQCCDQGGPRENRVSEVFAYLLTHILIFPPESRNAFFLHHVVSFAKHQNGVRSDDAERIAQFGEVVIRLCIANHIIPESTPRGKWARKEWTNRLPGPLARRDAIEGVLEIVATALPDYDRLWRDPYSEGWKYCVKQFEHIYVQCEPFLSELWSIAMNVYEAYSSDAGLEQLAESGGAWNGMRDEVGNAIRNGVPLVRCGMKVRDTGDTDTDALDPLLLGCIMLHEYIYSATTMQNRELYLHREATSGNVVFPECGRKWHDFLIDRGAASLFCCIPSQRGHRIQRQVAIIKTFWDIAANLRARRLHEIIRDNWLNES